MARGCRTVGRACASLTRVSLSTATTVHVRPKVASSSTTAKEDATSMPRLNS